MASNYPPGHPTGCGWRPVVQNCPNEDCLEENRGQEFVDYAVNAADLDAPEKCEFCGTPLDDDRWEAEEYEGDY
jgi:hypothetical protein